MSAPGMRKTLQIGFEEALVKVPEALKSEGFGVLTEIDVQGTLKQKLGVDFRRYRILGACNPSFAHEALAADLDAGLMLPCNVVVYEEDGGRTVVLAMDPTKALADAGLPQLVALADAVKGKLASALDKLS